MRKLTPKVHTFFGIPKFVAIFLPKTPKNSVFANDRYRDSAHSFYTAATKHQKPLLFKEGPLLICVSFLALAQHHVDDCVDIGDVDYSVTIHIGGWSG